jgi:hypothetical protein
MYRRYLWCASQYRRMISTSVRRGIWETFGGVGRRNPQWPNRSYQSCRICACSVAAQPAPGYNVIQTPDGGLSVEVLPSWGVETGKDSEKDARQNTWSYYAGEYLNSSITTASSLDAWYGPGGASGAYIVASKALAQRYTDDELIFTLLFEGKADKCTRGPYQDYNRPPYKGKILTWFDCGVNDATVHTLAAAPKGRKCVVVLDAILVSEADRKAVQHFVDTFEVDCERVTSEALPSPSAPASPQGAASPEAAASPSASAKSSAAASATASAQAQPGGCSDPAYQAQNPGECGTTGYNPASDPGDNYSQGVVVGDDTPDCTRPEDVLESGLCAR